MAYRIEKEQKGVEAIVVDGFEKGIADSPYMGISNMRNVNIKYYPDVAYGNYKRQLTTLSYGTFTFTGSLSTGTTSATLTGAWPFVTGNYSTLFSNGDIRLVTFTNGSLTAAWVGSGGLSSNATATITVTANNTAKPTFGCKSPAGLNYIIDDAGQIWKQNAINSSTFNLLGGSPTTGAQGQGIAFWENYLVVFRNADIDFCGDGTGDSGVTSANWNSSAQNTPLGNISNLVLVSSVSVGDSSAVISTYTDAGGLNRNTTWFGISGMYRLNLSTGENIAVQLEHGSGTINFTNAAVAGGTTSATLYVLIPSTKHMSLVSANDGVLYFCNGSNVGSVSVQSGFYFNPGNVNSFEISYSALGLPQYETINWLTELINRLMIGGNFYIYPWDRIAPQWQNPIPVPEQLFRIINIMNNLYILAGYKGNIYFSNGGSVSPFKKIPDYIAGTIDPQWLWGGIMSHRLRLWFQALAVDSLTGTNLVSGIFSLGLVSGNGITAETSGSLVMENQNSFGTIQSSTTSGGVLLSNDLQGNPYDNYYSAWSSGIGDTGNIDYNNTTLYSNNEMVIESDLIPIGTAVTPKTFTSAEFKLDQPLQSGDTISIFARQSLSDSYVQIGSTTTSATVTPQGNTISNFLQPISFQDWQWIQFKITMSCNPTATSSSFVRLREIRIR